MKGPLVDNLLVLQADHRSGYGCLHNIAKGIKCSLYHFYDKAIISMSQQDILQSKYQPQPNNRHIITAKLVPWTKYPSLKITSCALHKIKPAPAPNQTQPQTIPTDFNEMHCLGWSCIWDALLEGHCWAQSHPSDPPSATMMQDLESLM